MKRTRKMSCRDKKDYPSRQLAENAMHSYRRRMVGGIWNGTEVYKCGDHYHWGHYRKAKR